MRQKLIGIFLIGLFLLNYPVLSLFNRPHWVFKIPMLYFYLFAIWLVLIGLAYWVIERQGKHRSISEGSSTTEALQQLEKQE